MKLGFICLLFIDEINSFRTLPLKHIRRVSVRSFPVASLVLRKAQEQELISNDEIFENNGLFSWMQPFLEKNGFEEGKVLMNSIPVDNVDGTIVVSEEEAAERRRIAAEKMMNIGPEEIQRRDSTGTFFLYLASLYAFVSAVFLDQGDFFGHIVRLFVYPLFLTGYGFKQSARYGL